MNPTMRIEGEQFFDEYILVAPGSDYGRAMWSDIDNIDNGRILDNPLMNTNMLVSFLHHIHFSFAINKRVQLPLQSIWKRLYSIEKIEFDDSKKYCVIFTDVSASRTDCKYLAELRDQKFITLVLVMVNTMARRGSLIEKRKGYFSQIYSFDRNDCENYGFIYHPTNYSMAKLQDASNPTTDAFYVGISKGRARLLSQVYKKITQVGGKAEFYISGIETGNPRTDGIHYNEWLTYSSILKKIQNTNCIVEIMDGAQEGVTLRTMEAVCYNKKLLTNNRSLRGTKYYRTGYIQVFENPEDIDVDFIRRRENVDYQYQDEFSPLHLLEHINKTQLENSK